MSKIIVIVGQTGKSKERQKQVDLLSNVVHHIFPFKSWKNRSFDYDWCVKHNLQKSLFHFDEFDAGIDHRIMRDVVRQLVKDLGDNQAILVVYTLDMIDALLDEVSHENLTFVRAQPDGTCVEASAEDVAIVRELWGGDIR